MNADKELFKVRDFANQELEARLITLEELAIDNILKADTPEATIYNLWALIKEHFYNYVINRTAEEIGEPLQAYNKEDKFPNIKNPFPKSNELYDDFDYTKKLAYNICNELESAYKKLDSIEELDFQTFLKKIYKVDGGYIKVREMKSTPNGSDLEYNLFLLFDLCNLLHYRRIVDTFFIIFSKYKDDYRAIGELTIATNYQCNEFYYLKEELIKTGDKDIDKIEAVFNAYYDIYYNLYHLAKNYGYSFFHEFNGGEDFQVFFHLID